MGENTIVGPNCVLFNVVVGSNVRIGANCTIGLAGFGYDKGPDGAWFRMPHLGDVVIEDGVEIGSNTCIDRGTLGSTVIERGAKVDNLVHIAHNVRVGRGAMVIAHAMLGGSASVGEDAWIAPSAAVMNQASVGARAVVGLGAVVLKDVAPGVTVVGNPAKPLVR